MGKSILIVAFIFFCTTKIYAQDYPLKVVILGNSIVQHDPKPSIGWNNSWGMAASAKEKDFVHLIEKDLKNISQSIELKTFNIADFERDYNNYNFDNQGLNDVKNFNPDILVIRIGENLDDSNLDIAGFQTRLQALINYVSNNRPIRVVVSNSFWSSYSRDYAFVTFIQKYDYRFVDLKGLFDIPANTAQGFFTDVGVAKHPSDAGMQAIKDRVWKELYREVDDLICKYYNKCNYCHEGDYVGYLDKATCDSITGWVLDRTYIEHLIEVEVLVDGKPYVNLLAKEERSDLKKYYGEKGTKHGFKYAVPAGVAWKDGNQHVIDVKPCWKDAKVLNWSGQIVKCVSKVEPPSPSYVSGWLSSDCDEIIGWIYDKNNLSNIIKIDFLLNDKVYKTLEANEQRPDLLQFLSNTPDATKHIFVVKLVDIPKGNYKTQIRIAGNNTIIGNDNSFQCPKVVLGLSVNEEDNILVFPNPNHGGFKLLLPASFQNAQINLFDTFGREIEIEQKGEEIFLKNVLSGIFMLNINTKERKIVKKIIID